MNKRIAGLIAVSLAASCSSMVAGTVNILWYTGANPAFAGGLANYEADINNLVTQEQNPLFNVSGSVNTWNVTFWSGGAKPAGSYNVLVGGSENSYTPSYYNDLSAAVNAGSFGSRVMLTGQDADYHYIVFPGSANFNGPAGFLIDAINWAGSGTGMGGVLLGLDAASAISFPGETANAFGDNTVNIPGAFATFPINVGLTSGGLSNWGTSSHDDFTGVDPTLWIAINTGGSGEDVTIVSAQEASGGTGGGVPDATSTAGLFGIALAALFGMARFSRKTAMVRA